MTVGIHIKEYRNYPTSKYEFFLVSVYQIFHMWLTRPVNKNNVSPVYPGFMFYLCIAVLNSAI
jgi:hypothetical protein